MELPISSDSYASGPAALVRSVKRSQLIMQSVLMDAKEVDDAAYFVDTERAGVREANGAYEVVDDGTGKVLDDLEAGYGDSGRCLWVVGNAEKWEDETLEKAVGLGYGVKDFQVLRLTEYKRETGVGESVQVLPARAVMKQLKGFYEMMAGRDWGYGAGDLAVKAAGVHMDYLDESRLDIFAGRIDKEIVGTAGVLTLGQTGVVMEVFVNSEVRGKGVGKKMLETVVDHCERALFDHVLVAIPEGCPATGFYEGLGFEKVGGYRVLARD